MQSQQKRVKWSRGETAEALEERTDTGITQASVELMENCIPDVYGNVSRRPGLKILPYNTEETTLVGNLLGYDKYLQVFPFYITENDILLVCVYPDSPTQLIRIKDGTVVYKKNASNTYHPSTKAPISYNGVTYEYAYRPVSYAQQNNYMLIADYKNVYKLQISNFETADGSFTSTMEILKFSAGWYAPNGTQTKSVSNLNIPGLLFSGHFYNYTKVDNSGNSTIYQYTTTGVSYASLDLIAQEIPVGSIVQMPNISANLRVEGYDISGGNLYFTDIVFDGVLNQSDSVPATGTYCKSNPAGTGLVSSLDVYSNGSRITSAYVELNQIIRVKNSSATYGLSEIKFYYNGHQIVCTNWAETSSLDTNITIYGALLTPVADENATDSIVNVEYGYISLQPEEWTGESNYPHPKKLVFNGQRLWAGAWAYSATEEYAIVLGSQIARYNDFKNDYNQENEPITLDILTQYKERILHVVDYNGLKIMTDAYEYAYDNGAVVKQSANGSLEICEPIVFDSLCMYVDSTGCQVKAMQYELQNNLFDSTTINQLAPHDLVWNPFAMAAYEDKLNSTGKYLFLVNEDSSNHPRLAVCNFVPSNQVNIWNRWSMPSIKSSYEGTDPIPIIHSVVNLKNGALFMLCLNNTNATKSPYIVPAVLDFDANVDCVGTVVNNYYTIMTGTAERLTCANTTVAVYSDGEFQWLDTTTNTGALTRDVSGLTNVTVGLPIDAKIVSHPIDVGGKTKSIKKRIAKTRMSVHDTEPGAITINGKTGYMNPAKDCISFYGVTGMKDEVKYILTNNNGAAFHLESLLMNIEYGTLDS